MEQVHIERLRTLYSIMAGIPRSIVYMSAWRTDGTRGVVGSGFGVQTNVNNEDLKKHAAGHLIKEQGHGCGSAACALGWASAYPEFNDAGLTVHPSSGYPLFITPNGNQKLGGDAGAFFFGISIAESESLFKYVSTDEDKKKQGKAIFLKRLRDFLVLKNIITKARSKELEKEELQRELAEENTTFVIEVKASDD